MRTFKQLMEIFKTPSQIRREGVKKAFGAGSVRDSTHPDFINSVKAKYFDAHYKERVAAGDTADQAHSAAVDHANTTHANTVAAIDAHADTRQRRLDATARISRDPTRSVTDRGRAGRIAARGDEMNQPSERIMAGNRKNSHLYQPKVNNPFTQKPE